MAEAKKKNNRKHPGADLGGRCPEDREWMEQFVRTMGDLRVLVESREYAAAAVAFLNYLEDCKTQDGVERGPRKVQHDTPMIDILNERTVSILERAGYLTAGAVMQATDQDLLSINQIDKLTLQRIRKVLPYRDPRRVKPGIDNDLYAGADRVNEGAKARRARIKQLLAESKDGDR